MLNGVLQTILLLCLKTLVGVGLFLRGYRRVDHRISLAHDPFMVSRRKIKTNLRPLKTLSVFCDKKPPRKKLQRLLQPSKKLLLPYERILRFQNPVILIWKIQ
jgi:hypothetical protein